jgi:hypothetical protein
MEITAMFIRVDINKDKRHGYGEMYWTDGSIYKGEWINGIQHGKGTMSLTDGLCKAGIFKNNTFIEEVKEEEDEYLDDTDFDAKN